MRLRVHTPDPGQASWAGGHTLVEIVTDDMPFLVDSVTAELSRHDLNVHLVVHPQLVVRREVLGALAEVPAAPGPDEAGPDELVESWMHVEVDRTRDETELTRILNDLQRVLTDVREAVEDWSRMRDKAIALAGELVQRASCRCRRRTWKMPVSCCDGSRTSILRFLATANTGSAPTRAAMTSWRP
nr:NAD-glutamate dehydrogenase domain-containing protein [Fodinicola feengrottensis]